MIDPNALLTIIKQSRGLRWAERGRGPQAVDCFGFVLHVYGRLGVGLPDYDYAQGPQGAAVFYENYHKHFMPVERSRARAGDLVFMQTGQNFHLGLYAGGGRLAHCSRRHGVILQRLDAPPAAQAELSFYRVMDHAY